MTAQYNHYLNDKMAQRHLADLRCSATEARLASLARGPRPIRRRIGYALIAAGHALATSPPQEVAVPKSG